MWTTKKLMHCLINCWLWHKLNAKQRQAVYSSCDTEFFYFFFPSLFRFSVELQWSFDYQSSLLTRRYYFTRLFFFPRPQPYNRFNFGISKWTFLFSYFNEFHMNYIEMFFWNICVKITHLNQFKKLLKNNSNAKFYNIFDECCLFIFY